MQNGEHTQAQMLCRYLKFFSKKSIAFSTSAILQFDDEFRGMVARGEATCDDHSTLNELQAHHFDSSAVKASNSRNFSSLLDLRASLDDAVAFALSNAYASSTLATRKSQATKYLQFCRLLQSSPLPISVNNICRYCVFLGRTLKYSSILNYLDGLRCPLAPRHVRSPAPTSLTLPRATDLARPQTSSLRVGSTQAPDHSEHSSGST